MPYLLLLVVLLSSLTLSSQDESFRSVFGLPNVFGLEQVVGVERITDGYVIAGTREEGGTEEDVILWRFSEAGELLDSLMFPLPGVQYSLNTFAGKNNGFLLVWYNLEAREQGLQLTYFNADLTRRWHENLPGHRSPTDIRAIIFRSEDEITFSISTNNQSTSLIEYSVTTGALDTIYQDLENEVRVFSLQLMPDLGYLIGGSTRSSQPSGNGDGFLGLLSAEGAIIWEQRYPFDLGGDGDQTRRITDYDAVYRVPGRNLMLASYGTSGGKGIQRLDTMGVRLDDTFLTGAFSNSSEDLQWVSENQLYISDDFYSSGYLIETIDYKPTGEFTFLGINTRAGNLFVAEENLFVFATIKRTTPSNTDGELNIEFLNSGGLVQTTFGRIDRNTNEVADGLSVRADGSYNLITVLPDSNDIPRPAIIYANRFGEETGRIFLPAEDPPMSEVVYTAADKEGEYYLMSLSGADFKLVKANTNGEKLWSTLLPQGNTPSATKVAQLPDGNLLVADSYFDRETEALFPIIVRLLDAQGNELTNFSNEQITLRGISPIGVGPDSLIFVAGSNFNNSTGYLAAYKYGEIPVKWITSLWRPGYANHIASHPLSHSNNSVGVLLVSSFDTTGSAIGSNALTYIQLDIEGQELGRIEFPKVSSVNSAQSRSYGTDSLAIIWGQSDQTSESTGVQHLIRLVSASKTTLQRGRDITIRSPFGPANIAGVEFLADEKIAILFTSSGSAESFSNDVILVVLNQDGTITDIQNRQIPGLTLKVYPNPSSHIITAEISGPSVNESNVYRLISTTGRVVNGGEFTSDKMSLNISRLPKGTYFLHVWSAKGDSLIKKIQVQ